MATRIVRTEPTVDGAVLQVIAVHEERISFGVIRAQALVYASLNPGATVAIEANSRFLCPEQWNRYWWNRIFDEDEKLIKAREDQLTRAVEARRAEREEKRAAEAAKRSGKSMSLPKGRKR